MNGTDTVGARAARDGLLRRSGLDRRRRIAFTGFFAAVTLIVSIVSPTGSAQATAYPSWQDLQNAKANTSAAAGKVAEIQSLIAGLQVQVAQTQAEAEKRGVELQVAQQKFDDASRRAADIQAQADASKVKADAATRQAGQLAAQLYRTGGTNLSVNLLLDGETKGKVAQSGEGADALLSKLGNMSKLVERSTGVYEEAQSATNTAQSLGDQAKIAQKERETLRIAAEVALVAAQEAAAAAAAALAESEVKGVELAAQLVYMQDAQATTAAGYQAGVVERARLEGIRIAAERAARVARAGSGSASSQGWARPANGRITGGYGPRQVICGDGCSGAFHYATDIGTGCGAPIYAAHAGVVSYAARSGGTYGNFIKIDHGGNTSTGYAHIRDGGIFVGAGQSVSAGQEIGSSGATGAANGCHLHFEVWIGGTRINPAPFMADRGAALG